MSFAKRPAVSNNVWKYAEGYAEPDAVRLAKELHGELGTCDRVLVVPACREVPEFVGGYSEAARSVRDAGERLLLISVVNGSDRPEDIRENRACYEGFERLGELSWSRTGGGAKLVRLPTCDLLAIDCFGPGRAFGAKEGVGKARKWGCDVAVELFRQGALRGEILFCSDADARLPSDYFQEGERAFLPEVGGRAVAVIAPFVHVPSSDERLDAATELYELWFRYYVEGLQVAGSPYAFFSLGSTMAIDLQAYAAVRGFSQRLAGEDYYTLDKLAKLGPIIQRQGAPVELLSRRSQRVPFGTGPGVQKILEYGESALLFHPASAFDALRIVLEELAIFARRPDLNAMRERVGGRAASAIGVLEELGAFQEWGQAPEHAPTPRLLLRRLLGWFDGLKTLRFLNGIRARQGGGQTRKEALREASFVPDEVSDLPLGQQLRWFRSRRPPEQTSVLLSLERFLQGST